MGILSQTFGDKLNNFQTASSSSSPIQVTTTSGKQYSLDGNQVDWIKSRYKQDGADTYGWDDADQYAKQTGQLSAKMRSTYKNSNVDRQLAEMGLPSEKNLEKYIADYNNWHTGGISDYFGKDTPQDFYTKTKDMFKGDWQYDDTQEDQLRKSSGQMPSKLAAKYTDTEIDDELRAAGLPPVAEMGKYIGRYNNYSAIDNLYKNAAVAWANLGLSQDDNGQYIQNDNNLYTVNGLTRKGKDLYADAFYDEMGRKDANGNDVYGSIYGLFKNNHLEEDPDDYDGTNYNQYRGKQFANAAKVADLADDYAAYTAFSYDDFAGKYGDYYDQFLKGYKFSDGQTLEQKMANVQRANDEEAQKAYYDIEDKWFDGDVGIDSFIKRYQQDYPSNSYEQMFTDMYENGVSDKIVNKAMRAIRKSATQNTSQDGNSGYYDITNAYIRAKNKNDSAQNELWENINADPHDVEIAPSSSEPTNKRMTKDEYKGLDKEMWDYIDSSIKADEQDVATINTASDAIKNSLNMLFDADEGTVAEGDVDAVINLLNGIEKQNWNNPVAMRAALKEYGFNEDGTLSGTAAALTAGWSDENKRKLLRSIGNTVYSVETPDKDMEAALKAAGGNTELGSSKILHPDKKMDKEKFSYALEWAQEQIASGKLTEGDAYNILAGSGFQDELDEYMPEEWHRAVFEDFSVPALFEQTGGVQLAMWEEMTPEEQKKTASDMWNALSDEEKAAMYSDPNWWKSNPYIYRTFGQALEQQFSAVIPSLATDLAAGGVETVDAILANISGRPEMWGITQDLMDAEQFVNAYGSVYDNTNGAQIASIAADATAEIAKMFMLGSLGAEIGSAFETTEVGSLIAGAAGSTTPVVKQVAGLFLDGVKSSPFMVSAFAHNYAKAKTMGATNGEATRFGVVTGLLEGFWEGCNFDKLWGRVIGGDKFANMLIAGGEAFSESSVINMARVANMVVSGFSEWTEESLGYVGETLWETTSRWGKDKSEWSFEDYWEQASMGFLTGFIGAGISSGAINRESILYNYWAKNGKIASHIMDVAVAESIYNQATEAERDEWRNGDVHVMSQEDYAGLMVRLDTLNRQQDSEAAKAEYKDREDKANKKYNDVKAVENKLRAEAAALNPLDAEDAKKIGKLAPKVEEAARASSEAALVREDTIKKAAISMDERIEQENSEREKINRLVREHFAALYLQNESAIARRNEEEIRANVSRDRQNGAEVTPETRATAQEAPANNVAQSEANPATTENPEAAAREAAYDRVYTDQEAGKAYGNETKNAKGSKLTRVEFAENERQNFQAKTTAKQGKVTLELAGLEAAEGMSDKEIITEAKKAMTPDAAKKLDVYMKLSKALGLPMVIRDVVAGTSGYVHDGKLYVTLNGKQALLRVTAHEVTHWMKEHLPSGYDVLRTRLINDVGGQEAFDELVQKKAQEYVLDLNTEKGRLEADDEVCAELCEKMFENKDALEKFVNEAPEAAKTLKARLAKTLVAIKQAIKSLGTSSSKTSGDLIKDQDTIELWYKTLSDAIDAANAEAKGKVQPTIEDVATETETSTEAQPQAPPAPEGVEELGISSEEVRKQNLRSELEELAKKGTKVKDFDRASVNEILDRVIVGDRTNYSKADYAQIRGMLAQLIPEIKAMVDGDTSVDFDALNERVQTALNYMLDRYSEPSAELYDLREIIPGKIALTETAYNELRKNSQMTLREASNRMTRALGKFVNFVYKGSPNYSAASTIDEVWRDIGYEPKGQGTIAEDADALIKYVEERAERSSYDDLYKSQREDMVSAHAGEFLDAVQSMVEGKAAETAALHSLDDDYMPLAEKYDAGIATDEDVDELQSEVDDAARVNGYTIKAYHGTTDDFTEFKRGEQGRNHDGYLEFGAGFYFTPSEKEARQWVERGRSGIYGKAEPRVMSVYLNPNRIIGADDVVPGGINYLRGIGLSVAEANFVANRAYRFINYLIEDRGFSNVEAQETMKALGFDAIDATLGNGTSGQYVVFDPEQIKSADLVTYDNDNNIIPLSERFNPNKTDIRWSVDDDWDEAVRRYGAKPQGMNPRARDVQVPERLNRQSRLSDFLRSLTESGKVTDDQVNDIKKMVVEQNYMSYIPTSVSERMEQAQKYIAQRQPLQAQQEFHDMVTEGKGGANTVALGIQLLSDAAERGDIESVLDTAADLQILATDSGQSVQAFSVLKQLKGVGSAWYMQKLVDRLNSKYADRIAAGKMDTITVSPELMAQLAAATNVNEIEAAEEAVAKEIAGQLPLTWTDRMSNWRYFSMLANPVTHFRNIFGNVLMGGMNMAKDVVATGLERTLNVAEEDRAHAVLTAEDRKTWGDWAQKSYDENARNLRGGGKLGFETFVKQNMRSFDTKFLNALAKFNFDKLEGEDIRFIRPAYKNALMQYMKAQGYTLNAQGEVGKYAADGTFTPISNAKMTEAEEWASNQAWKATFRDASDLATMLNKVSKMNSVSRLLVEGVMPFKKTPVNIAKRGIEYSPAGIVMGVAQLTNGVKKGKYTPAQAIDTLASGLTGSALMTLGVFLAKLGVIRGGGEDKKKYETYLEDTGDQTYAFKIGDVSINMSSIAPATIPLFMGVALEEMLNRQGDSFDLSTFTDTIAGTLNPLMEMSFMSSLNSALQNYNNNGIGGALGNTVLTAAQNYGSQYLPTAVARLGQLADPVQRTTKSSATSPIGGNMDYYVRSLAKKVPGATAALEPDVNVWGQTNTKDTFGEWLLDVFNKFVLPTNVKITNRDAVDKELIRLVESTGGVDFLPSDGNKYFTVSGQTYKMNARQYTEFSKERGEASYAAIKEVMNSPAYVNANDTQRADMLEKALKAAQKQVNTNWKYKLGAFD